MICNGPLYFSRVKSLLSVRLAAFFLVASALFPSCRPAKTEGAIPASARDSLAAIQTAKAAVASEVERVLTKRPGRALLINRFELEAAPLLRTYYQQHQYTPLWYADDERNWLLQFLQNVREYGLEPSDYLPQEWPGYDSDKDKAQQDVLLSNALIHVARDLAVGRFAPDSLSRSWTPNSRVPDLSLLLDAHSDTAALKHQLSEIQPDNPMYHSLQKACAVFVKHFVLEDSTVLVPIQKTDSVAAHKLARSLLHYRGFLDTAKESGDSMYLAALRRFQAMHGLRDDGLIGTNTAQALGRSNRHRYQSICITLERWRWESAWPQPFAWVALPGFELQIVDHDSVVQAHRVVVGTRSNQTPEITSAINVLVAYPYWHVPYSISSKELLPKAQQDAAYLGRNGYTVRDRSGQVVDPQQVDWSGVSAGNFPYQIRQNGGTGNALGLVKFLFPNPHSVYLHDTNAKKYFDSEIRSFSHGCVRLDDPMRFAAYLLERDTGKADLRNVQQAIDQRRENKIPLSPGLPVYFRHFTARGGADGWPLFHVDLYGEDAAYKKARAEELVVKSARRRQLEEEARQEEDPQYRAPEMEAAPTVSP